MKYPISENELGLVQKYEFSNTYYFHRNGDWYYEREANKNDPTQMKGRFMTFSEYKNTYKKPTNYIFGREK